MNVADSGPGGVVAGNADSVFYATRNSNAPGFKVARYDAAGWSDQAAVDDGTTAKAQYDLFVEAAGRALSYYESSHGTFVANRYQPGQGWSAPRVVANSRIISGHSLAAMDASGNVVIAWPGSPTKNNSGSPRCASRSRIEPAARTKRCAASVC